MVSFNGIQHAICVREFYRYNDSVTVAKRTYVLLSFKYTALNQASRMQLIREWV